MEPADRSVATYLKALLLNSWCPKGHSFPGVSPQHEGANFLPGKPGVCLREILFPQSILVPLPVLDCPSSLSPTSHPAPLHTLPPFQFQRCYQGRFAESLLQWLSPGPFPQRLCARVPFTEAQQLCPSVLLAGATKHLQGAAKAAEAQTRGREDLANVMPGEA